MRVVKNNEKMKNMRVTIVLFVSVFLLSTCSDGDDYGGGICPVRCPSSRPWVVNHTSASQCYATEAECIATGPGGYYGCIKCDY